MATHTRQDLKIRQALPLKMKVAMTRQRIKDWVDAFGEDGVYVAFSGGKDSTVLLHLVREIYHDIPAVFVDTGLEYPEIRDFVKSFDNVIWLKPKMNFKKVIETYGYPFISKEVSGAIGETYKLIEKREKEKGIKIEKQKTLQCFQEAYDKGEDWGYENKLPIRILQLLGKCPHKENGVLTDEFSRQFDMSKYGFVINAPMKFSNRCCGVMKKAPFYEFVKETGRHPMTAQMAEESKLRTSNWLLHGCNGFDMKSPISNPMAFWTEQDVLRYIKENDIKLASVYGDVVTDYQEELDGQMDICDLGLAQDVRPLKTTGCQRTGCMFCGYGCHLEKNPNRFEQMKITHPKQYEWIMKKWDEGGLGYKDVIDWLNENGNLNIRY